MIDAPAQCLIAHEVIPGYEPRRYQPDATGDWPHIPATDGTMIDASQVPAYGTVRAQEMAYLAELSDGWYAITNPTRQISFGMRFETLRAVAYEGLERVSAVTPEGAVEGLDS